MIEARVIYANVLRFSQLVTHNVEHGTHAQVKVVIPQLPSATIVGAIPRLVDVVKVFVRIEIKYRRYVSREYKFLESKKVE